MVFLSSLSESWSQNECDWRVDFSKAHFRAGNKNERKLALNHLSDPMFLVLSNRVACDGGYINNILHLARKNAWIFVRGHYLFQKANSFPRAKLEENCELPGSDIWAYFQSKMEAIVFIIPQIYSSQHAFGEYRGIFPGILRLGQAKKNIYLMDYKSYYVDK